MIITCHNRDAADTKISEQDASFAKKNREKCSTFLFIIIIKIAEDQFFTLRFVTTKYFRVGFVFFFFFLRRIHFSIENSGVENNPSKYRETLPSVCSTKL